WTLKKLTLNLGVRYDRFHGWVPATVRPAGPFVQQFSFPEVDNVPLWHNVVPRLGASYDVFGNGKTAVKFTAGEYLMSFGPYFILNAAPANSLSLSATRTWSDANGNFVPDCALANPGTNGECGPVTNSLFGTVVQTTRYDSSVTDGWNKRE